MNPNTLTLTSALILTFGLACGIAGANQPQSESENQSQSTAIDNDQANEIKAENHEISLSAYVQGTLASEADFDADIGTFEYSKFNAGIIASRKLGDSARLSVSFDAGLINYDISTSPASVVGDAASIGAEFDDVTTLSLIATYTDRLNDSTTWFLMGGAISAGEDDADFSDSLDGLIGGGFLYEMNDKLKLGLGVVVKTQLDDDVLIVPVPQIQYTLDDRWSINTQGIGVRVNYKASDSLDYGVSGQYESTTFRLDDSHASATDGMATHRSFPVAFYAKYSPNDTIEISGQIGGLIAGELEILNTSGNEITAQDIDTGIFGSITVSFKF